MALRMGARNYFADVRFGTQSFVDAGFFGRTDKTRSLPILCAFRFFGQVGSVRRTGPGVWVAGARVSHRGTYGTNPTMLIMVSFFPSDNRPGGPAVP